MALIRILFTALTCFLGFTAISQDTLRVDSLLASLPDSPDTNSILILRDVFMEYVYHDPPVAKKYAKMALEITDEVDVPTYTAKTYNMYGVAEQINSNFDEAIRYGEMALAIYEELGDMERVSAMYNNIGNSYRKKGDITTCLDYHMESLRIKEEIGVDPEALAASFWNIGNLHGDVRNYPESNVWYRKAERIYEELDIERDLVEIRYNIGLNLSEMDSMSLAMEYFEDATNYYKANNQWNDLAGSYDNLGGIYRDRGNLELAERYYLQSLDISKNYGERTLVGLTQRRLGRLYTRMGRYDEAEQLLFSALEISEETGVRKKMITDYLALAELYAAKGDYRKAYDYHVEYAKLDNEVLNEQTLERINELEIKYQTEQKEKEIIIQEKEIDLLKQRAELDRIRMWLLILGIVAILAISSGAYYGARQKIKRSRAERQKLDTELDLKKKELTGFTLQLAHKNEVLESLKEELQTIKRETSGNGKLGRVIRRIDYNIEDTESWEQFQHRFEEVHKDFNSNAKRRYPSVTKNDLRLMALMKMNLSNKEIANILNISNEGIKKARYRLKKKMELDSKQSLDAVILRL